MWVDFVKQDTTGFFVNKESRILEKLAKNNKVHMNSGLTQVSPGMPCDISKWQQMRDVPTLVTTCTHVASMCMNCRCIIIYKRKSV
jgi:hypothetical protein